MLDDPTDEVTDLLRTLIRNACVNDGTDESGQEARSADVLASYLEGSGLDLETFEPTPGRRSLVARLEGSDPSAPTVVLMGHTDVVPANPDGWRRDPYAADLVDGEVWGRGATDMLNLTTSMAVATKALATSGFRPKGTLVYLAVADEEALGTHGAAHLVTNEPDAVLGDYVITEGGGSLTPTPSGPKLSLAAGEKGTWWAKLTVRGTPSHASRPLRTDNALVKAAAVVTRLAEHRPKAEINDIWRRWVEGMGFDTDLAAALVDPDRVYETALELPSISLARTAHACTHTTIAPTVVHGGTKTNVIPDRVTIEVDVRTLPGQTGDDIRALIDHVLGDLAADVEIDAFSDPSTASSVDTPLFAALQASARRLKPEAEVVPSLMAGATDARFFRRAGVTAYGFGLMSGRIPIDQLVSMFHGDDERIDQESLRLTTLLWEDLARSFLG